MLEKFDCPPVLRAAPAHEEEHELVTRKPQLFANLVAVRWIGVPELGRVEAVGNDFEAADLAVELGEPDAVCLGAGDD